jgi:hypothetical protein
LSGKLAKPVTLDIAIRKTEEDTQNQLEPGIKHIQYILGRKWHKTATLEKGEKYG